MSIVSRNQIVVFALWASTASCGGDANAETVCIPGETVDCACHTTGQYMCGGHWLGVAIGLSSIRTCAIDGSGWGRCDCGAEVPECVAACEPSPNPEGCTIVCSAEVGYLMRHLPPQADPSVCRAAYLSFWQCKLQDGGDCSAQAEAVDTACTDAC